jgi:hypothetical protein
MHTKVAPPAILVPSSLPDVVPSYVRHSHHLLPPFVVPSSFSRQFPAVVPHGDGTVTRFLALDKCLPRRDFIQVLPRTRACVAIYVTPLIVLTPQVVEFPAAGPKALSYDEEWFAILKYGGSRSPRSPQGNELAASKCPVLCVHAQDVHDSCL